MDGLEDQAEAALAGLLNQLRLNHTVEIGRSSRDSTMFQICEELKKTSNNNLAVKSLVMRGGISLNGLRMLQQALQENDTIEELTFVSLKCVQELQGAMECCRRQPRIRSLSLTSYNPPTSRRDGEGGEVIATTIRDTIFGEPRFLVGDDHAADNEQGVPTLKTLEIVGYPIGTRGTQVLADSIAKNMTITTLRLMDCDLRSDCANSVAQMIKGNRHLKELDLSFNRHYLGSEITRELTLKTMVQRGLRFNMSLLELKLPEQTVGGPFKRGKIDRQLDISRFRASFVDNKRDPFSVSPHLWTHVLARVSPKPSALYLFLLESAITIFR